MSKVSKLPNAKPRIDRKVNGSALGIISYDEDNGYPQRMDNLYNASSTAKKAAALCARYIVGKGFENLDFYSAVIGRQGKEVVTPDKLLRKLALSKARFRGFAIHINYNQLYEIDTVKFVPFKHCREADNKHPDCIAVYDDWYTESKGGQRRKIDDIDFINLYDPRPEVIQQQVNAVDGWVNYKGQIYYYSEDEGYPLATIDPNIDDVEAEIASKRTRKNNVATNFQMKKVYVSKGKSESDDQDEEEAATIRKFMGPEGDSVLVVFSEDEDGKDVPDIKDVKTEFNDKIFAYTDQVTRAEIYGSFNQPAILHSDYQGTNGYNEGQLPQSQEYYNSITEPDRILFEEVYREIFSKYKDNINADDNYKITPLQPLKTASNGSTTTNIES